MNILQIHAKKIVLTGLLFLLSLHIIHAQEGKQIFQQNCATCHNLDKDGTGPALRGVTERGPWAENRATLHAWIKNAPSLVNTMPYTQQLKAKFNNTIMTGFANVLSDKQIDAVVEYLANPPAPVTPGGGGDPRAATEGEGSGQNAVIFGIISLVLAIITLILMQVNSSLKKLSDDKQNIQRPEPVPFYRNKIYIATFAVVLFIVGGYLVAKGAIGLGRQQGYQPTQPIYYSHKVHAGINQISCLYCHGGAWESKHAGIPSLNICMNCHKVINSYEKGPELKDEEGNKIDGTAEIQKLYRYANFTPNTNWDPSKATSPEWVKIHNLPDHVYFNHAQHTRVGGVQCQTCHGNIQQMDKVQQQATLSMGWCINCHRETKVNFKYDTASKEGNKFYSIYERFRNDFHQGKMDSVTVKDIGGLECQKCHY